MPTLSAALDPHGVRSAGPEHLVATAVTRFPELAECVAAQKYPAIQLPHTCAGRSNRSGAISQARIAPACTSGALAATTGTRARRPT